MSIKTPRRILYVPVEKMAVGDSDNTLNFGTLVYREGSRLHPWTIACKKPIAGFAVGRLREE